MSEEVSFLNLILNFMIKQANIIIAIFTAIAAVSAAVSARATWKYTRETEKIAKSAENSAKETEKIVMAQIINQIRDSFSSPEMSIAMNSLKDLKSDNGVHYPSNITLANMIDEHRRIYSHLFHKLKILLDSNCISEDFINKIIYQDEVYLLLNIVEPLEQEKNPDYNKSTFETFRKIFERKDS
jgi:hypothetical protein